VFVFIEQNVILEFGMAWNQQRAEARIRKHLTTVPEVAQGTVLAKRGQLLAFDRASANPSQFPRGRAQLVEGVHLYGLLLDFDELVVQDKRETEASHAKVLRFLHANYQIWDSIVDEDDAIRVDYHGPRLHAVVTEPEGDAAEQIRRAIALAVKLEGAAQIVGQAQGFPSRLRFGIDHGQCLAMTTGRSHERDILFLGRPANYAAKLVAASRERGIFLTDDAKKKLGLTAITNDARSYTGLVESASAKYQFQAVARASESIAKQATGDTQFQFHRAIPPLAQVKFEELSPSRSIRMGMASIFADIDQFTHHVDMAIEGGAKTIADTVRDIHVLREELNSVLKEDFGGKRVRFIGDCIQGVLAEGERADDPRDTIQEAVLCAAGMRSSFSLAQAILKTIDDLDLAVGIEYGQVPLTRLGTRGEDSVRCAAALAVTRSEQLQQDIEGGGIKLGQTALQHADENIRTYFSTPTTLMEYPDAATHFGSIASPAVHVLRDDPTARPHAE
jgi:class 3 adenylate cyclase